jgi:hypothetical protein
MLTVMEAASCNRLDIVLYTVVLTGFYRHFPDGGKTTLAGKETTCPRHSGRFQVRKTAESSGKTAGKRRENSEDKCGKTGRENRGKMVAKQREKGMENGTGKRRREKEMKIRGEKRWFSNTGDSDH